MPFDDGIKTVSGSIAHTDDAATKVPFVSVKCGIKPTLTGVTEIDCTLLKKNFFSYDLQLYNGYWLNNTFNGNGQPVSYASATGWHFYKIPVKEGDKITCSGMQALGGVYCAFFKDTPDNIVSMFLNGSTNGTRTVPTGANFVGIEINRGGTPQRDPKTEFPNAQLEISASATAYEVYSATLHHVELGRTVHGGSGDVANGVGTETYSTKIIFDGSNDEVWQKHGSIASWFFIDHFFSNAYADNSKDDFILSSWGTQRKYNNVGGLSNGDFSYGENERFVIKNTDFTEVADFKEWLSNNPISIVYKLATPTDFTFTPITPTPETVGKVNNVYCNTGNTEVTYYDNAHGFSEVTVNKTGKNLFDISKVATTGTTAGISWSVSGNEITISGTATTSGWKTFVEFKLPHKGTYHFHMNATGNVGYFLRGWTQLVGKDVTEVCNDPSQTYRIAIAVATSGQSYSGTISEIQIEVGDSYTEYEPYEAVSKTAKFHRIVYGGQADVVKGTCEPKNLLKLYLYRTSHLGVNFSLTDDGLLHMEGTNTSTTGSAFSGGNYSTYDDCPWKFSAGTYTASSIVSADLSKIGSVNLLIRTKSDNVQTTYYLKDAPKTFTVNEDFGAWFWASVLKTETVNCDVGVQLEKGSTASDFAPHFDPFTFPPISISTDEGENTLFANDGDSAITYRRAVD